MYNVSFHRFPSDPQKAAQRVRQIRREDFPQLSTAVLFIAFCSIRIIVKHEITAIPIVREVYYNVSG